MIVDELIVELQAQSSAGRGKYVVTIEDENLDIVEVEEVQVYHEEDHTQVDLQYYDKKGNSVSGAQVLIG